MALPYHALKIIANYLKGNVLSLGYPDIDATPEQIKHLFGYTPTKFRDLRDWHGVVSPDTEELFEHLPATLTVVDYIKERGIEIIADLNEPHEFGKFDLVIDPGTLEHCFNIGQAFFNAANAVAVGGRIFHLSPMTMLNHGFYNLNPTLFVDFYGQNEWAIESMSAHAVTNMTVHSSKRFTNTYEHILKVLAIRKNDAQLKYPTQYKYLTKKR
jgi:2-polyprenyl-3-methyl-5-hydroxy-6-metoxy-1,4-benzoquinol methylase